MATKAERFRAELERSGPKKAPRPKHPRRSPPADTSLPGVGADARRAGAGSSAARSASTRAGNKASVALEDSAGTPSRKSTRRGANRVKAASNLTRRTKREARSPESRAVAASAKATRVRGVKQPSAAKLRKK